MSRPVLYATLAVLLAVLFGTSYALNRQAQDPKQTHQDEQTKPAEQITPEKKAEMMKRMETQQKEQKNHMQQQMKRMAEAEKEKAARLAALGIKKPKSAGVDIDDKWFKQTADGPAGIQQAIKEKQIIDQVDASMPSRPSSKPNTPAPISP